MKKKYTLSLNCSHEGCNESTYYNYDTQKEYREGATRNTTWKCVRHTQPEAVLSITNLKTESILIAKEKMYDDKRSMGNFWQKAENAGTNKVDSAFQYGNGYKAYAYDFPEGTILKITAEIILPSPSPATCR